MLEKNQKRNQKESQSRMHSDEQTKTGTAKRKKRSKARRIYFQNKAAMKCITVVVCLLFAILLFQGQSLKSKVKENETKISQLQDAYDKEQERTKEIEALLEYMKSEEYIEKYAKKIGLLKENEILFKENK